MELTELKEKYATELMNMPNIKSKQTISGYVSAVTKFYRENNRPYRMSIQDIKEYMGTVRVKYSDSYYNVIGSAIKILFSNVFNQPRKMDWFVPIKIKRIFHNIVSQGEFIQMGKRCKNSKHKLILVLLYSSGIRRQELIDIKLSDIDFRNKRIFIRSVKGGKNRFVKLHKTTQIYLITYLREWRPKEYLFNGQNNIKYSGESVNKIIKNISDGKYHPHSLRHTFITNLIEHENIFAAQDYAGHNSTKSTLHYYHISPDRLDNMYNPLDDIKSNNP